MTEKIRQYPITTIALIVGCFIIICAAFVVLPSKVLANQANTKDDTSHSQITSDKDNDTIPSTSETETEPETEADEPSYSAQDLDELSRIIYAEAGSYWIPDEIQKYVGSVILNRVDHPQFPNNIHDVLYQSNQYGPVQRGTFETTVADERAIANAKWLLENGSILPANVVFQGNSVQGNGIYYTYSDPYLGNSYFCYTNE